MSEKVSCEPIWKALGYSVPKHAPHKPWLWIWSRTGGVRGFRPSQLGSMNALTSIYPDLDFWREAFPYRRDGSAVDVEKARSVFVALCYEAGAYDPPAELRPLPVGRPKRSSK